MTLVAFTFLLLLVLPPMVIVGWNTSRQDPEDALSFARRLAIVFGLMLLLLVVTGLFPSNRIAFVTHHFFGRVVVFFVEAALFFLIGVKLQQSSRQRFAAILFQCLSMLFLFAITFLGSLTGYMGPIHNVTHNEATHNRFIILHLLFFPALMMLLLIGWLSFCRRRRPNDDA